MEEASAFAAERRRADVETAPEAMRRVTGVFDTPERVDDAVQQLVEASFPSDSIDILMVDRSHGIEEVAVEQKTRVAAGATVGAAAGVALGLTAVTIFPGLALLVGGPLVATLHATVAGTIGGALNGLGWWRSEAEIPSDALEGGGALVGIGVQAERAEDAAAALRRAGAKRVDMT